MPIYFIKTFLKLSIGAFLCLTVVLNFTDSAFSAENSVLKITTFHNTIKMAKDDNGVRNWQPTQPKLGSRQITRQTALKVSFMSPNSAARAAKRLRGQIMPFPRTRP